jgi:hypothetical protein
MPTFSSELLSPETFDLFSKMHPKGWFLCVANGRRVNSRLVVQTPGSRRIHQVTSRPGGPKMDNEYITFFESAADLKAYTAQEEASAKELDELFS